MKASDLPSLSDSNPQVSRKDAEAGADRAEALESEAHSSRFIFQEADLEGEAWGAGWGADTPPVRRHRAAAETGR